MNQSGSVFDTLDRPAASRGRPRPGTRAAASTGDARNGCLAQLFVFEGDDYLGWDCFEKDTVFIGGGDGVDLRLDDPALGATQAVLHFDGRHVAVHDPGASGQLRVNDEPVHTRVLGALDVIGLGRYCLKVRIKRVRRADDQPAETNLARTGAADSAPNPADRAEGKYPPDNTVQAAPVLVVEPVAPRREGGAPLPVRMVGIAHPMPVDEAHRLGPGPAALPAEVVAAAPQWETMDSNEALELFEVLVDEVVCDPIEPAPSAEAALAATAAAAAATAVADVVDLEVRRGTARDDGQKARMTVTGDKPRSGAIRLAGEDGEDDEDDEPDLAADFTLADRLYAVERAPEAGGVPVVEVARFHDHELVDLCFLQPGDNHQRTTRTGELPIVWRAADGSCRFFFDQEFVSGTLTNSAGEQIHTDGLCTELNRSGKKGNRFQLELADGDQAVLHSGYDTYLVRWTLQVPGPDLVTPAPSRRPAVGNLLASGLLHLLLVIASGLVVSLPDPTEPPAPEARFVQIDTREVETLTQPKPTPTPRPQQVRAREKQPPPPPPRAAKETRPRPTPKPDKQTAPHSVARAGTPEAATATAGASAHPDAGGGHGGNTLNRNLKQEGVLAALGIADGVGVGAKQALAAVTNLEVVATPHGAEAGLQVGGIVARLGEAQIALPTVGLVSTKGTSQVVASGGVGGEGTVAALARGETGRGQVMGLVSADLKAPVQIQGGMTREEVKQVIDRHMEEISYCYETALIEDPSLVGKMTFEWRILASGEVGEVRIQASSIRSDSLHTCIEHAIQTWNFPKPRGGAEVWVSYPFIFDVVGF